MAPLFSNIDPCPLPLLLIRLRATASALQLRQGWVLRLPGGFNEQALSNIVYAFDRAQALDRELLQAVFAVAAMRLDCNVTGQHRPAFKPQELCTLLRAAHTNIAEPWVFLGALSGTVAVTPFVFESWSGPERAELQRALALLDVYRTTLMLQQLQMIQQQQQHLSMVTQQMSNLGLVGGPSSGSSGQMFQGVCRGQSAAHRLRQSGPN